MWWTLLSTIMVDTTTKLETRTRPTSHIRSVLLINFLSYFCWSLKCPTVNGSLTGLRASPQSQCGHVGNDSITKAYCQFWGSRTPSPNPRFSCLHRLVCGVLGYLGFGIGVTNTHSWRFKSSTARKCQWVSSYRHFEGSLWVYLQGEAVRQ